MPPVPPVPVIMPPVDRLDQRVDRRGGFDGVSTRRKRQAGRRPGETETGGDEGRDDKCTHLTLPSLREAPTGRLPVVWRLAAACCGPRVSRWAACSSVDRIVARI